MAPTGTKAITWWIVAILCQAGCSNPELNVDRLKPFQIDTRSAGRVSRLNPSELSRDSQLKSATSIGTRLPIDHFLLHPKQVVLQCVDDHLNDTARATCIVENLTDDELENCLKPGIQIRCLAHDTSNLIELITKIKAQKKILQDVYNARDPSVAMSCSSVFSIDFCLPRFASEAERIPSELEVKNKKYSSDYFFENSDISDSNFKNDPYSSIPVVGGHDLAFAESGDIDQFPSSVKHEPGIRELQNANKDLQFGPGFQNDIVGQAGICKILPESCNESDANALLLNGTTEFESKQVLAKFNNLPKGSAVISAPLTASRDETFYVVLMLSSTRAEIIKRELSENLGPGSQVIGQDGVKLSRWMTATLYAPGLLVAPANSFRQSVDEEIGAKWEWLVTASKSGKYKILVTASAEIWTGDQKDIRNFYTYAQDVSVKVTPSDFLEDNWTWLFSAAIIPGAVGSWNWWQKHRSAVSKRSRGRRRATITNRNA